VTKKGSFSRPVKVDALPRDGLEQTVEATPAERAAVAEQQGLVDVVKLTATFLMKRAGKGVRVTGAVHAELTQTCVVTLEPFPVTLDEPIDVRFARPTEEPSGRRGEAETLARDAEDPPDPIVDGKIDLRSSSWRSPSIPTPASRGPNSGRRPRRRHRRRRSSYFRR
jgi:uncharacterized metal-binding protein YceD (DUF177 family)